MGNTNGPLVSIIIPVYNVEKYLEECVGSVLRQTYSNIEIILVDDGSKDNSGQLADKLADKDARIRVIHQQNKGVAAARNCGFDNSNGDFILYIDSDDWVTEDHVEHLMYLQSIDDSDMCMTTKHFLEKTDTQDETITISTISGEDAAVLLLSPKVIIGCYDKIYRKSWLMQNGIRQNEMLFSGEGLNYIVTAAEHANHVTISNRRIYYYRRNVAQSATTKFNIKMFTNNELSLDLLDRDKVIDSRRFNEMLEQFRVHLMIGGVNAILIFSDPKEYPDEYHRWRKEIRRRGTRLLNSSNVELRYKIRIIGSILCPRLWAIMAKTKRDNSFKNSV